VESVATCSCRLIGSAPVTERPFITGSANAENSAMTQAWRLPSWKGPTRNSKVYGRFAEKLDHDETIAFVDTRSRQHEHRRFARSRHSIMLAPADYAYVYHSDRGSNTYCWYTDRLPKFGLPPRSVHPVVGMTTSSPMALTASTITNCSTGKRWRRRGCRAGHQR
jgi:hypothetical protein